MGDTERFAFGIRPCVNGVEPEHLDPLVRRIVDGLEKHTVENHNLETEAKLGLISGGKRKSEEAKKERLKLPGESEAILEPSSPNFEYEFQAGVTKEQFAEIRKLLDTIHRNTEMPSRYKIHNVKNTYTVDEMYLVDKNRVRISFASDETLVKTNKIVDQITKRGIEDVNIWSGPPDTEDSHRDIRVSFRNEEPWTGDLPDEDQHTMTRTKKRTSYEFGGWQADITEVQVKSDDGFTTKYEVEFELKRELILQNLASMKQGKSHSLYSILHDFVWFVRDMAWYFSHSSNEMSNEIVDLIHCRQTIQSIANYEKKVCPVLPIIGQYLFEVAAELAENPHNNSRNSVDSEDDATPRLAPSPHQIKRKSKSPERVKSKSPNRVLKSKSPARSTPKQVEKRKSQELDPDLPVFTMDFEPPPFGVVGSDSEEEIEETPLESEISSQDLAGFEDNFTPQAKKPKLQ